MDTLMSIAFEPIYYFQGHSDVVAQMKLKELDLFYFYSNEGNMLYFKRFEMTFI